MPRKDALAMTFRSIRPPGAVAKRRQPNLKIEAAYDTAAYDTAAYDKAAVVSIFTGCRLGGLHLHPPFPIPIHVPAVNPMDRENVTRRHFPSQPSVLKSYLMAELRSGFRLVI